MGIDAFGCNCRADIEVLTRRLNDLAAVITNQQAQLRELQNAPPSWFPIYNKKEDKND